ncbi:MAG: DNA translocase FtsK 4TM domain-containing protein [Pseudomonadota bacterium]
MAAPEQTQDLAKATKPGRLVLHRVFWIVLACFVALSIFSHDANDPAWTQWGSAPTHNAAGQFGAYLSDILGFMLGTVVYAVPFLFFWRVILFWHQPPLALTGWRQAAAWVVSLFSLASLLALHQYQPGYGLDNAAGGLFGRTLGLAMWQATGLIGGSLILGTLFVLTFTLASGISWPWLLERIGRALWLAVSELQAICIPAWQNWRAKRHATAGSMPHADARSAVRQEPVVRESAKPAFTPRVPETQATPLETPRPKLEITIQPIAEVKPAKKPETQRQLFAPPPGEGSLPSLDLLDPAEPRGRKGYTPEALEAMSRLLEIKLKEFNVDAEVVAVQPGPVITRFEIQPAPGVKVARITNIAKDLARAMAMVSVRVVEVIPGKSVVGIEVPNQDREMVRLSEILTSQAFESKSSPLTLALGKDIAGHPIVADLARMPHLLVAGTTGSGKSVGVNAMILSMLFKATPAELRLIMIDPKMLELSVYDKIPHLLTPVVTDMKDAANALRWCVAEMERRYKLMSKLGVRNLDGYNKKVADAIAAGEPIKDPLWKPGENVFEEEASELGKLPFVVVIIDEFADMIMIVGKKVEELIARIAQKARAAGIHLILATQRPSVDVITGLIKANVPTRIAFQVSSRIDSRTILDQGGAEMLLGHGDMLFLPPGTSLTERVHGAFVSDDEVHRVCGDWRARGQPDYIDEILEGSLEVTDGGGKGSFGGFDDVGGDPEQDALYDEAVAFVLETRRPSISYVQRKFKIGYNRAARLVEAMENAGVVSAMQSNGQREIVVPRRD